MCALAAANASAPEKPTSLQSGSPLDVVTSKQLNAGAASCFAGWLPCRRHFFCTVHKKRTSELEQNTKKHDEEHQAEYEEAHTDVAEDREHEKEDMGLKEGKALVLLYPTLSVWLQRALTKDSKAVHGDTGF